MGPLCVSLEKMGCAFWEEEEMCHQYNNSASNQYSYAFYDFFLERVCIIGYTSSASDVFFSIHERSPLIKHTHLVNIGTTTVCSILANIRMGVATKI